jgi:hypothetical protein
MAPERFGRRAKVLAGWIRKDCVFERRDFVLGVEY